MNRKEILVSFVIPAHNEEKYIAPCIESIIRHAPHPESIEIIVVDNKSTDRTAEIAKKIKNVVVVSEPRKGLTRARQKGLETAHGEFVAYLDADTRLSQGWFGVFEREFSGNKNAVSLSGPPSYYDLPKPYKFLAELGWKIFAPIAYSIVGYMVWGGNFVAKRNKLLEIGGFDETIPFHGEDTNIARRLSMVGKVLFRMDFNVLTSGRRIMEEGLLRTYVIYGVNFLWQVIFHKPRTLGYKDIR